MRRGQTLVLFAVTMLAIVMMIMITIGLGVRIHERQEQQIVADAAAYSQAVVTARTFNMMAVMNRTLIAQMSTIAAAQSMLSFAGFYHGVLNQARDVLIANSGACPEIADATARIEAEDRDLIEKWEPPGGGYGGIGGRDRESGAYVREVLYQTALDIARDQKVIYMHFRDDIAPNGGRKIAGAIAERARAGSPWSSNPNELKAAPQAVSIRERDDVVTFRQQDPTHMVRAVMGTRGIEAFLSSRESDAWDVSGAEYIRYRLQRVIEPTSLVFHLNAYGTSYFGDNGPQERSGYYGEIDPPSNWRQFYKINQDSFRGTWNYEGAWAQDYGYFRFTGSCIPPNGENSFGYIHSNGPGRNDDNHMWARGNPAIGDYREWNDPLVSDGPEERHTFDQTVPDALASRSNTIWPIFVDFNEDQFGPGGRIDLEGQPKSMVPIVRDYSVRTDDPWEFKFSMNLGATPGKIDLKADRERADGAIELQHSVAIGTGLTYYHRGDPGGRVGGGNGHAREPPNFFNPFWRATLVASDVDERHADRGDDIITTLNDLGRGEQVNALNRLRSAGFKAIP